MAEAGSKLGQRAKRTFNLLNLARACLRRFAFNREYVKIDLSTAKYENKIRAAQAKAIEADIEAGIGRRARDKRQLDLEEERSRSESRVLEAQRMAGLETQAALTKKGLAAAEEKFAKVRERDAATERLREETRRYALVTDVVVAEVARAIQFMAPADVVRIVMRDAAVEVAKPKLRPERLLTGSDERTGHSN